MAFCRENQPLCLLFKVEKFCDLRKKIFIMLSRIPYPLEKGDKLRAFYQIRELSKHHDLIICALHDAPPHPEAYEVLRAFSDHIYFFRLRKTGIMCRLIAAVISKQPFQVAYFYNRRLSKKIHTLVARYGPDHIYCQLIRTAEYMRNIQIDKTLDYQDVFSAGLKRRMGVAPWYLKALLKSEYLRVKRYEKETFDFFDKHTIISYPDRELISHHLSEKITVIPNGVDTDYFKPVKTIKTVDLIFSGNMGYPPNIDGAVYLVREIMPLVWKEDSGVRVAIVGATPAQQVRALASERVIVTGWVEDIRSHYAASRVFVAPMRIGTGLQNKVLEAMAMQLPCITSPLANKALSAIDGKQLLIGRNTEEYAEHILSLLRNSNMRKNMADNGYQFVLKTFNWQSTGKMLESVIVAEKIK